MLTAVAFKYVVSQDLPNLSYLTFLDKFILSSFGFLALIVFQNAFAATWITSNEFDKLTGWCLAGLWVVHLGIAIWIAWQLRVRNQKPKELKSGPIGKDYPAKFNRRKSTQFLS